MRPGNKLASYRRLAEALQLVLDVPWHLTVIGDGAARAEVGAAFDRFPRDRITWLGLLGAAEVAEQLAAHHLFVWPGVREPFGLVFLEAQAMGLPVVGLDDGGVTAVVKRDETGYLTPPDDVPAFAAAVRRLLGDPVKRSRM